MFEKHGQLLFGKLFLDDYIIWVILCYTVSNPGEGVNPEHGKSTIYRSQGKPNKSRVC